MIGKVYKKQGGSGGEIINGIIEQYKASTSTISANSFVEFVNGENTGNSQQILSNVYTGTIISVQVDENKALLLHSSDSSNAYLNGVVCTISNGTITAGADTRLVTSKYAGRYITAVKIESGKVFITCGDNNATLNALICSINNATISVGNVISLVDNINASTSASTTLIDNNKVVVLHNKDNSSSSCLMGIVCTISNTTITKGTDTTVLSTRGTATGVKSTILDTNKVLAVHSSDNSSMYLNAVVCMVSGTSISVGSDTRISSSSTSNYLNVCTNLDKNKALVIHRNNSSNNYIYGIICTISNNVITVGNDTQLVSQTGAYTYSSLSAFAKDKAYITHRNDDTNHYLTKNVITASGTSLSISADTILDNNKYSAYGSGNLLVGNNKIMVFYSNQNYNLLNGIIVDLTPTIKESVSQIDGITKEEITTSTAGDVWVLNQ